MGSPAHLDAFPIESCLFGNFQFGSYTNERQSCDFFTLGNISDEVFYTLGGLPGGIFWILESLWYWDLACRVYLNTDIM